MVFCPESAVCRRFPQAAGRAFPDAEGL